MREANKRAGAPQGLIARLFAYLALLVASGLVFADLAEDYASNEVGWDERFARWIHDESSPPLVSLFEVLTIAGSTVFLLAVVLTASALLAARRRWSHVALMLFAFAGGAALNSALKAAFARERPPFADEYSGAVDAFSFPSAHASASIATYGALAFVLLRDLRSRRARVACVAALLGLVVLIGFSRLYLGVHYLSDVLVGLSLGLGWLMVCLLTYTGYAFARGR